MVKSHRATASTERSCVSGALQAEREVPVRLRRSARAGDSIRLCSRPSHLTDHSPWQPTAPRTQCKYLATTFPFLFCMTLNCSSLAVLLSAWTYHTRSVPGRTDCRLLRIFELFLLLTTQISSQHLLFSFETTSPKGSSAWQQLFPNGKGVVEHIYSSQDIHGHVSPP